MISTMWSIAPAGVRGPVGVAVRAADCAVESAPTARLRAVAGTRVPAPTGFGTAGFGTAGFDIALSGIDVVPTPVFGDGLGTAGYPQQVSKRTTTEHNGTTLGIHSSRRPSS